MRRGRDCQPQGIGGLQPRRRSQSICLSDQRSHRASASPIKKNPCFFPFQVQVFSRTANAWFDAVVAGCSGENGLITSLCVEWGVNASLFRKTLPLKSDLLVLRPGVEQPPMCPGTEGSVMQALQRAGFNQTDSTCIHARLRVYGALESLGDNPFLCTCILRIFNALDSSSEEFSVWATKFSILTALICQASEQGNDLVGSWWRPAKSMADFLKRPWHMCGLVDNTVASGNYVPAALPLNWTWTGLCQNQPLLRHDPSGVVMRAFPVAPFAEETDTDIILFHYTNKSGFESINASSEVWATLLEKCKNPYDTCFGDGTYATAKDANEFGSVDAVLQNNYGGKWPGMEDLADFCIPIRAPRTLVYNVQRDVVPSLKMKWNRRFNRVPLKGDPESELDDVKHRPGFNRHGKPIGDRDIWVFPLQNATDRVLNLAHHASLRNHLRSCADKEELKRNVLHPDPSVKVKAIQTLGLLMTPEVQIDESDMELFIECLYDTDRRVRAAAVTAIGHASRNQNDEEIVDLLWPFLDDDRRVGQAAVKAILMVQDIDFGCDKCISWIVFNHDLKYRSFPASHSEGLDEEWFEPMASYFRNREWGRLAAASHALEKARDDAWGNPRV